MKSLLVENVIKNIVVLLILLKLYPYIQNFTLPEDFVVSGGAGDLLVVTSIICVTACFGCFAFTYERILVDSKMSRHFGHLTTGLLILVLGLSLMMTSVFGLLILPGYEALNFILALLYLTVVCYDFWDLQRAYT